MAPAKKTSTKEKIDKCKKCDEKCKCDKCNCSGSGNQAAFYVLVASLVVVMTVLIISLSFNKSVRDLFKPSTYAYNGMFDKALKSNVLDENGFTLVGAGAVIDMLNSQKSGLLIVGEENCITCDAFARRVAEYESDTPIYRYNIPSEPSSDDINIQERLGGCEETPVFIHIKGGTVFDRLDDVKEIADLEIFMQKYAKAE
jgi:hypothetical protein